MPSRYDGHADWYEQNIVPWSTAAAAPLLGRLAGPGPGRCLDLGCGTGVHLAGLAAAGWSVVGIDASADQLRLARQRSRRVATLVQGDATRLPFPASSFALVVSAFTHTDVDDFAALAAEAGRVLAPDGRFVYVGLHPCFKGPMAEQPRPDGAQVVHAEYRQAGWRTSGPGTVQGGLTSRVGFRHLPLADLLNCVPGAGLRLTRVEEGGPGPLPDWLAFIARR